MTSEILGIHHITALASDPQRNVDFYVNVLGLRLVKQTVNFDAPDIYHFYYGDNTGSPGTLLTFFPFPDAARGKPGSGEVSAVAFIAPLLSRDFWISRLSQYGIPIEGPFERSGEEVIAFQDPDGLRIELVFSASDPREQVWANGPVPPEYALQRFYGATLTLSGLHKTATLLGDMMGFRPISESAGKPRYTIGEPAAQTAIDIVVDPSLPPARISAGSVHHIAWRVADDAAQKQWREKINAAGLNVTEIVNRLYFHSIYFHEPGGVLFEIATDPPGCLVDESIETLGSRLVLPPWLESHRREIEQVLPAISIPTGVTTGT